MILVGVYDTAVVSDQLSRCDDIAELKNQILPMLQDQRSQWKEKIEEILRASNYSCRDFASLCKVSEPAVRKWRKGSLPQSRDMFIRIGFAAGYDLGQMNAFLLRYGRCPQLYIKSLEDSVCMFVLNSSNLPHTYKCYEDVLSYVKAQLEQESGASQLMYNTIQMSAYFSNIKTMEELLVFAKNCALSYAETYHRLYDYVLEYMRSNSYDFAGNRYVSANSVFSESEWSSSLRHCFYDIRNRRWFPLRQKLISLGLHLNMNLQELNEMLSLAKMEPLYSKNPVEATVIFALVEAELNDRIFRDGSNDLCLFVKEKLIQMDLQESEYLIDDL